VLAEGAGAAGLAAILAFPERFAGKTVGTTLRSISKDGKVMTLKVKGTDAQGKAYNNVMVFEKQ